MSGSTTTTVFSKNLFTFLETVVVQHLFWQQMAGRMKWIRGRIRLACSSLVATATILNKITEVSRPRFNYKTPTWNKNSMLKSWDFGQNYL